MPDPVRATRSWLRHVFDTGALRSPNPCAPLLRLYTKVSLTLRTAPDGACPLWQLVHASR